MTRLFVGNFDFEHQLAGVTRTLPGAVDRLNRELASCWVALADDGDFLWDPGRAEEGFWEGLRAAGLPLLYPLHRDGLFQGAALCPWGWTEQLRTWATGRGVIGDAPPPEAVRLANSRAFSYSLEREWNIAPEGSAVVSSRDELAAAMRHLKWVIKAEYGMSARERIVGSGPVLTSAAEHWVHRKFGACERLYFEPWLDRVAEAGCQFTIPKSGEPVLEGITPMFADASGVYRGSRFTLDSASETRWAPAVEFGRQTARRAQAAGYFGPLGIDAMLYRDEGGNLRLRPLQDVNARYTMGRLALGFRRLLQPGEWGSWLHVQWPTTDRTAPRRHFEQTLAALPADIRVIRTAPFEIDDRPVSHGTLVVIAPSLASLSTAERAILQEDADSLGDPLFSSICG